MITVERRSGIVSGVSVFPARLVNPRKTVTRAIGVFRRKVVVRVNLMMIEVKRDLKIIREAVLKFFAKIEHAIGAMFLFPTRRHPLFKLPSALRQQIGRVSPCEDGFIGTTRWKRKTTI